MTDQLLICVVFSEMTTDDSDFDTILRADQKNFIAERVDVDSWIEESRKFRHKLDFFMRLNKIVMNIKADRTNEATDKVKQQALKFQTDFMHCEQFNPIEN